MRACSRFGRFSLMENQPEWRGARAAAPRMSHPAASSRWMRPRNELLIASVISTSTN